MKINMKPGSQIQATLEVVRLLPVTHVQGTCTLEVVRLLPVTHVQGTCNNPILIIDPNGMMTWKGVLGTIGMNIVGLGSLYLTGGKFGGVGYWDDETGDVAFYGGGYSGAAYGGGARVNYKSGRYELAVGIGHMAPMWGGGFKIRGNWNYGTFQARGVGVYAPWGIVAPFNVYNSQTEGWGFTLNITKTVPMDPIPNWHKSRNFLNHNTEGAPEYLEDARKNPNWEEQKGFIEGWNTPGWSHGGYIVFNGTGPNAGKQVVYNPKNEGRLVTGEHAGTYDYYPPGQDVSGHVRRDYIPWLLWGDWD